jgi:hypothetical protein
MRPLTSPMLGGLEGCSAHEFLGFGIGPVGVPHPLEAGRSRLVQVADDCELAICISREPVDGGHHSPCEAHGRAFLSDSRCAASEVPRLLNQQRDERCDQQRQSPSKAGSISATGSTSGCAEISS